MNVTAKADSEALLKERAEAKTALDIIAAIARILWFNDHGGDGCPKDKIPASQADLEALTECAPKERHEVIRLIENIGNTLVKSQDDDPALILALDRAPPLVLTLPALPDIPESGITATLFTILRRVWSLADNLFENDVAWSTIDAWCEPVHELWQRMSAEGVDLTHPLVPLVRAWQTRPHEAEPERRKDKRILPRIPSIFVIEHPEREAGMLFGGINDKPRKLIMPELPLFPNLPRTRRVPILDIVDASGVPIMTRGTGVPLEARLVVRTAVMVKPKDRGQAVVRMAVTVKEFRDGLFPNGWQRYRDWPRMRSALMNARDFGIRDANGGIWFLLAVRRLPGDNPSLKDLIVIDVSLPPGSETGPTVNLPEMDNLMVESAPRWRAYIAAHSLAWVPVVTRVRHPSTRHWLWTRNEASYPILTLEHRRLLAFGLRDTKHRTVAEIDEKWRDVPGTLVVTERAIDPRTGEVGWRVLPIDAARAVSKTRGKSEPT